MSCINIALIFKTKASECAAVLSRSSFLALLHACSECMSIGLQLMNVSISYFYFSFFQCIVQLI